MSASFRPTLERLYPEAIAFLRELVEINSHTANIAGVEENAERIIRRFAPLGFSVERVPTGKEGTGEHLFLDSGDRGDGAPVIAMISHLDTVFSTTEEQQNDFSWREAAGGRIYGPGTIDIKGGTVMIWLMLAALAEADPALFHSVRWVLAWDAMEEIGASKAFGDCCRARLPSDTRVCLIFEPDSGKDGNIAILHARKGLAAYRLKVSGRGAHAGIRPESGASAIHQLARAIDQLHGMADYEQGISVNAGVIQGGSATNRVAHEAEVRFEMRAYDSTLFEETNRRILALSGKGDVVAASDGFACTLEVSTLRVTPPWPRNEHTDQLIAHWLSAAKALDLPVVTQARGGVSDGNFLAPHYPSLDGLGPIGGNAHCSERSEDGSKDQEYVEAESFVPKAELNLTALRELLSAPTSSDAGARN